MLDHVVLFMALACRFPTSVGLTFRKSWSYSTIAMLKASNETMSSKASCVNLKSENTNLPGRLGDPQMSLKNDPRAIPAVTKVMSEFGLDG